VIELVHEDTDAHLASFDFPGQGAARLVAELGTDLPGLFELSRQPVPRAAVDVRALCARHGLRPGALEAVLRL
jgi:hypothetical protein